MTNMVWTKGRNWLDGELQSSSEVDFYIDGVSRHFVLSFCVPYVNGLTSFLSLLFYVSCLQDMIHIADTKVARRYGDYFIRQIHKLDDVGIPVHWFHTILHT